MKGIRFLKKSVVVVLFLFMIGLPFCQKETATTVYASEIQPMSDDIRWVYEIRNGVYYKRLYNFTTRSWIGEWIRVS